MPQEGQCWMRINESKHAGRKVEEGRCRLEGFLEEVGGIFFFCLSPDFFFFFPVVGSSVLHAGFL